MRWSRCERRGLRGALRGAGAGTGRRCWWGLRRLLWREFVSFAGGCAADRWVRWMQAGDCALLCYSSLAHDRHQQYQHAHVERREPYHHLQPCRVLLRSERRSARCVLRLVLRRLPDAVVPNSRRKLKLDLAWLQLFCSRGQVGFDGRDDCERKDGSFLGSRKAAYGLHRACHSSLLRACKAEQGPSRSPSPSQAPTTRAPTRPVCRHPLFPRTPTNSSLSRRHPRCVCSLIPHDRTPDPGSRDDGNVEHQGHAGRREVGDGEDRRLELPDSVLVVGVVRRAYGHFLDTRVPS